MAKLIWKEHPVKLVTNERHVIVAPTVRARLQDEAGAPVVGQACLITGPDGFRATCITDADGRVRVLAPKGDGYQVSFTQIDAQLWGPEDSSVSSPDEQGPG